MEGVDVVSHVRACFDALYQVLGESAPMFTNDAYVIRTYEMGRAFGAVTLELRSLGSGEPVEPLAVIRAVLQHAVLADDTGAMTLYAVAMVVGPRLLVTLVDAREHVNDPRVLEAFDRAAEICVAQMRSVGEVAKNQAPIDDENWQDAARDLTITLESSGNTESFGFVR